MLDFAKKASQKALEVLQQAINFGLTAADIIQISGSLQGIIGVGGKGSKSLVAKIQGCFKFLGKI
jgi:hypothetical protein